VFYLHTETSQELSGHTIIIIDQWRLLLKTSKVRVST